MFSLGFSTFALYRLSQGKFIKTKSKESTHCDKLLKLIYIDIIRPLDPTINDSRYFITFIDDCSRYGFVELIREKADSLEAFKAFKAKVELQQGKMIKVVHSDRGGEYYGRYDEMGHNPRPFAIYLQECGIDAIYTMPSTPQQNGVAERKNCTLFDMVRCILSNSSLPEFIF